MTPRKQAFECKTSRSAWGNTTVSFSIFILPSNRLYPNRPFTALNIDSYWQGGKDNPDPPSFLAPHANHVPHHSREHQLTFSVQTCRPWRNGKLWLDQLKAVICPVSCQDWNGLTASNPKTSFRSSVPCAVLSDHYEDQNARIPDISHDVCNGVPIRNGEAADDAWTQHCHVVFCHDGAERS